MTLLITGASGFVGLNVIEAALARGDEVVALAIDDLPRLAVRAFSALPGRLHAVRGDVLDATFVEEIFRKHRPSRVIPAAALTPGATQERERAERTLSVNVVGVVRLLEAAARWEVRRIVFPSSASVYGANAFGAEPLDEVLHAAMPESVYAVSKLAAESLALRFRALAGLDVVAARLGTVFGPWERDTGMRETLSPHWQVLAHLAAEREVVLPGPGRRDWIYSRDIAGALLHLLDSTLSDPAVVNVGPGHEWTMAEWCVTLAARRPALRWRMAEPGETANVNYWTARDRAPLANLRLTKDYGFRPSFDRVSSVDDILGWQAMYA